MIKSSSLFCCFMISFLLLPQTSSAQSANASLMISNIKRDTTYLYAEATMKDKEEAFKNAHTLLGMKVKEWLMSQAIIGNEDSSVDSLVVVAEKSSSELSAPRGEYCRAFVYVKKSVLLPARNDPNDFTPNLVTLTADERNMIRITQFDDIEPYVKGLEAKGRVKAYGKYATMPKNEMCHVFIYDRQGDIKAVLRVQPGSQLNLRTMRQDNIKNYKNHGALWLQLKNE